MDILPYKRDLIGPFGQSVHEAMFSIVFWSTSAPCNAHLGVFHIGEGDANHNHPPRVCICEVQALRDLVVPQDTALAQGQPRLLHSQCRARNIRTALCPLLQFEQPTAELCAFLQPAPAV